MDLILYGIIGSLLGVGGGALVLVWRQQVKKLMTSLLAFAAAAFLGVSFLDLLPEAVEAVEEPHFIFISFLVGLTLFFILERALMKYLRTHEHSHGEHEDEHTESLPALVLVGDALHNFIDGIAIAIAYVANPALGLTTALAIAAHEIPQEIGDFSILLDRGWSNKKVILANLYCGLTTFLGIGIGYYAVSSVEEYLPYFLAGVAGIFTYIGLSDLVPEIHHRAGHRNLYRVIIPFVLGLVLVGYLAIKLHA
jgi:zinc and cadmium transporter